MIPKDKEYRLIKIYMYICDMYEQSLKYHCQRYSNNSKPLFSDEEILTIYFFVGHEQKYTLIKDIHNFAKEYLRDWFPNLVSYQTFNYRLNRMAGAVRELSSQLLRMFRPSDCQDDTVIVDSMPIITSLRKKPYRQGRQRYRRQRILFHQEPVLSWTKASHGRISQERASSSSVPDSALSCLRE